METQDIGYADLHFLNEFHDPKPTEMGHKGRQRLRDKMSLLEMAAS